MHDLGNATNEELAFVMESSSRPVCGIFNRSQLNKTFFKAAAATLIAASLSSCSVAPEPESKIPDAIEEVHEPLIFGMIDQVMPSYKGGTMNMMATIRKNLKIPPRVCIEGAVYVSFVVKADGTIADWKVVKGISPEIDEEAMRVVGLLREWIPGEQGGKKVDVKMIIPIKFSSGEE